MPTAVRRRACFSLRAAAALPAACLAVGLAAPFAAHAYRPFDSGDASVADTGVLEVETAILRHSHPGSRVWSLPALALAYGVDESLELGASASYARRRGSEVASGAEPGARLEELALSFKRIVRAGGLQASSEASGEPAGASLALECALLLPSHGGHAQDAQRKAGGACAAIASRQWRRAAAHLTASYTRDRYGAPARYAGMVLEGPPGWHVRPALELGAERAAGRTVRSALAALMWQGPGAAETAFAVQRTWGVALSTEVRFGVKWALRRLPVAR